MPVNRRANFKRSLFRRDPFYTYLAGIPRWPKKPSRLKVIVRRAVDPFGTLFSASCRHHLYLHQFSSLQITNRTIQREPSPLLNRPMFVAAPCVQPVPSRTYDMQNCSFNRSIKRSKNFRVPTLDLPQTLIQLPPPTFASRCLRRSRARLTWRVWRTRH